MKAEEIKKRVYERIKKHPYSNCKKLSKAIKISKYAIYRAIRQLRKDGIGVMTTSRGYVLAEVAERRDDVSALRRWNARRTSDYFAVKSAREHIEKRWYAIKGKGRNKQLETVYQSLFSNVTILEKSTQILLKEKNSYGL